MAARARLSSLPGMKHIAVMIVDDHARVRQGLRTFLSTCPDLRVVAEAANGEEALECCVVARPDVIVMDMMMPAMDGPTATGRIRELCPDSKIIALSSFGDPDVVRRAMEAGAAAYVHKDSSPETLVEAIRDADHARAAIIPNSAEPARGRVKAARQP
jgi:NarL family two-component system response regulator LiaR